MKQFDTSGIKQRTVIGRRVSCLIQTVMDTQDLTYTDLGIKLGAGEPDTRQSRRKAYLAVNRWVRQKHLPHKSSIQKLCTLAGVDYGKFMRSSNLANFMEGLSLEALNDAYDSATTYEPLLANTIVAHAASQMYSMLYNIGIHTSLTIEEESRTNGLPQTVGVIKCLQSGTKDISIRVAGRSTYIVHSILSNYADIVKDSRPIHEFDQTITYLKHQLSENPNV
jgi:hypothetical protein